MKLIPRFVINILLLPNLTFRSNKKNGTMIREYFFPYSPLDIISKITDSLFRILRDSSRILVIH